MANFTWAAVGLVKPGRENGHEYEDEPAADALLQEIWMNLYYSNFRKTDKCYLFINWEVDVILQVPQRLKSDKLAHELLYCGSHTSGSNQLATVWRRAPLIPFRRSYPPQGQDIGWSLFEQMKRVVLAFTLRGTSSPSTTRFLFRALLSKSKMFLVYNRENLSVKSTLEKYLSGSHF